jgi:putative Holliday junction resolvase
LAATLLRPAARAGTILAFDFGTRRIGVAVGETTLGLAHPLATIAADGDDDRLAAIASLVREWQPALLVVGLPTHADGTPHAMTARAQEFARRLEARFRLTVELGQTLRCRRRRARAQAAARPGRGANHPAGIP